MFPHRESKFPLLLMRTVFALYPFQSLSMLLNGTPFAFVIDLAALASRREYLKLDKWLTDKIREHGVCIHVSHKCRCFEGFHLKAVSPP